MEKLESKNIPTKKIQFQLQLNRLEKMRGILTSNEVGDTIRVALPQSFGGEGNEWSPEHLFLASISSCYMTTFLVLAERKNLAVSNFECYAEGQIQWLNGRYQFASIQISPRIIIQDSLSMDMANSLMKRTEKYCIISNAVSAPISYNGEVNLNRRKPAWQNKTLISPTNHE